MVKNELVREKLNILWFKDITIKDIPLVGGKNASLGEMYSKLLNKGIVVPNGFAVTANAYWYFLRANKLDKKINRVFVLMGDGETQEGSVWEAAMFAAYQRLNNLIVIIDYNGLSATDFLKRYLDISPLGRKWESFGWDTIAVNGHSFSELILAFKGLRERRSANPLAIIAVTTKGKGVSFMEDKLEWHYKSPNKNQLNLAIKEIT